MMPILMTGLSAARLRRGSMAADAAPNRARRVVVIALSSRSFVFGRFARHCRAVLALKDRPNAIGALILGHCNEWAWNTPDSGGKTRFCRRSRPPVQPVLSAPRGGLHVRALVPAAVDLERAGRRRRSRWHASAGIN